MQGLPSATPDELLATQDIYVLRLRESSKLEREDFDRYILPCLRNYARFVHLLPASQEHHHRGAGGLLRHGMEVASYASGIAYATAFASHDTVPSKKKDVDLRWRNACLLSGLCHDLGKPIADLDVADKDGEIIWDPFDPTTHYMTDFLEKHGIENYYLRWRRGRHRNHEDGAGLIFPRIVPPETLSWLGQHDPDTRFQLYQYVTRGNEAPSTNRFRDIVMRSDKGSVLDDMKAGHSSAPSGTVGFTPHRHIIAAMRYLFTTGAWKINQVGGRVFVTDRGLFIAWAGSNSGGADVAKYLRENQIPGITHDPDGLASDLLDIDVAEPFVSGEATMRYWKVSFSVPAQNGAIANISMNCLKIREPDYLLDTYVAPIAAVVDELDEHPDERDGPEDVREDGEDGEDGEDEASNPARKPNSQPQQPSHAAGEASPPARKPNSQPNAAAQSVPTITETPQGAQAPGADTTPVRAGTPQSDPRTTVESLFRNAFPSVASSPNGEDHAFFAKRGPHAKLWIDVAAHLRTHQTPPSWFTIINQEICLEYPQTFAACGIDPLPKPADLAATAMLRADPQRPGTILHKNPETGRNSIRMTRQPANAFASLVIFGHSAPQPARRTPSPPANSPLSPSTAIQAASAPQPADSPLSPSTATEPASTPAAPPRKPKNTEARASQQPFADPGYRPSAAGLNLLELLRRVHAEGQWGDDALVDEKYVYLHPDAVRRFADAQGYDEPRLRDLLRVHDCVDVAFPGATRHGMRFPF
jgi:conjugal transfer pilus assembly protein TraI